MHMLAKGYWEKMCCCSVAKLYPILCNPMNCMQHSRLPRLSLSPRVCSYSCPFSQWCHPTITSPVTHFCSCPQSFPASGSFQMSQLSASGGQIIGVWASTSVLPMNTQDWSPLWWTGWISFMMDWLDLLAVQRTLKSLLQHHSSKVSTQLSL